MRTVLRSAAFGAMLAGLAVAAQAQSADSPAGLWKTIDDQTKEPKALIRIAEQNGVLTGRIERILAGRPDAVCEQCADERKGRPVQGMTILSGLRKEGDEWAGGEILDPGNGKTYRARVKLVDGGRRLDVRGYIGTPRFGRSQTWVREN